jgi:hypothetical protein
MLTVLITCIVVLPVLLGFYVVHSFYVAHRSKPGRLRLRLRTTLLKLVSIEIEVDAQDKPDELPLSNSGQSPDGRPPGRARAIDTGTPGVWASPGRRSPRRPPP